ALIASGNPPPDSRGRPVAGGADDDQDHRMSTAPTIPFSPVSPEAPGARPGAKATPRDWLRRAVGDAAYLTLGLATGTAFFSIAITLGALSIGLLVLVIGIPVAMVSSEILRWCAEAER